MVVAYLLAPFQMKWIFVGQASSAELRGKPSSFKLRIWIVLVRVAKFEQHSLGRVKVPLPRGHKDP